jgi:Holliday junction DNA helicase RuvB
MDEHVIQPACLADFLGQEEVVATLNAMIASARLQGLPVGHCLLLGKPGLGKSTLAGIVAAEMGSQVRAFKAPSITRQSDLAAILVSLQEGDVLYLDEIERLRPTLSEELCRAVLDLRLRPAGLDAHTEPAVIAIKGFTLIGAAWDESRVGATLRGCFERCIALAPYPAAELERILQRAVRIADVLVSPAAIHVLAEGSHGLPLVALRLFQHAARSTQLRGIEVLTEERALAALAECQFDTLGLDRIDREYLGILASSFQGGPVGARALETSTLLNEEDMLNEIEPRLMHAGLIRRGLTGRALTERGWECAAAFIEGLVVPAFPNHLKTSK